MAADIRCRYRMEVVAEVALVVEREEVELRSLVLDLRWYSNRGVHLEFSVLSEVVKECEGYCYLPPAGQGLGVDGGGLVGTTQFGPCPPLVQQYGGTPPYGQGLGVVGVGVVATTQLGPVPPLVQQYGGIPPNGQGRGVVGPGVGLVGTMQFGPEPPLVQQ